MKKQPKLRTASLVLASCLTLGLASCSTTKSIPASSHRALPAPINGNSVVKDVAYQTVGAAGVFQQRVLWPAMTIPVLVLGEMDARLGAILGTR